MLDQVPDNFIKFVFKERRKIFETKANPGRSKNRQPGDAVGRMRERARERVEVLHHLLLAQLLDLHRAIADARVLERRHDGVEMAAVADQYRHLARRFLYKLNDFLSFKFTIEKTMPGDSGAGLRRFVAGGRGVRDRAGCFIGIQR